MKGNFRTLLRRFCLEGSVLGLKYFYLYPDPFSRCFWALTMLMMMMATCVMTFLLHQRFTESPTRITIDNPFASIQNIPYPAITLCSPNQITASAVKHFKDTLVNGNLTLNLNELIPQVLGFNELLHDKNPKHLEQFQDIITINRYSKYKCETLDDCHICFKVLNMMSLLSQSCEAFLKRCFFENKLYPCEELFNPILTTLGVCCTFNNIYKLNNNKRNEKRQNFLKYKVKKLGFNSGLTVITDYAPNDAADGTILHAGATGVIFTDWSEFPVESELSLMHPASEVFLHFYITHTYCSEEVALLPVHRRKCFFSDEMMLPHFKTYRHTDCQLNCLISFVERQCQCLLHYVPNVSPHRVCNFTAIPCISNVKINIPRYFAKSHCHCERDCVSRQYSTEHYSGNINAIEHMMIKEPYSGIVFNESTTIMHFFPKSTYVKQKQETVISLTIFFSNLGGVFGLCLGLSSISLFEICFYIYIAIRNYFRRWQMTRRRRRIRYCN